MLLYLILGALLAALLFSLPSLAPKSAKAKAEMVYWGWFLAAALVAAFLAFRGLFLGLALPVIVGGLRSYLIRRIFLRRQAKSGRESVATGPLDRSEALKILGLKEPVTRAEVETAHKALMAKMHPDKGGNDWIAGRLNAARDLLLHELGG